MNTCVHAFGPPSGGRWFSFPAAAVAAPGSRWRALRARLASDGGSPLELLAIDEESGVELSLGAIEVLVNDVTLFAIKRMQWPSILSWGERFLRFENFVNGVKNEWPFESCTRGYG